MNELPRSKIEKTYWMMQTVLEYGDIVAHLQTLDKLGQTYIFYMDGVLTFIMRFNRTLKESQVVKRVPGVSYLRPMTLSEVKTMLTQLNMTQKNMVVFYD